MVEYELLVGVGVDILGIKLAVELLIDVPAGIVLWAEQVCPRQWLLLTFALLFQCIRTDKFGVWEGLVPVVHEDVVLGVVGTNVFYRAHLVDLALNIIRESYGREDCYAAVLQADCQVLGIAACSGFEEEQTESSATTNVDLTEARKGQRECDNVWSYIANDHDLVGVRGNELASHVDDVMVVK